MASNTESSDKTTCTSTESVKTTSTDKEKLNNFVEAFSTAGTVINNIQENPSEENVRKQLACFVTNRDLTKRELCPHGCSFLCRMCDG